MRNVVRILLVAVVFGAMVTMSGPAVKACPDGTEIDINYFDWNGCWQGEHYVSCWCDVSNFGTLTGAQYKHLQSWACDGSGMTDQWYVWNGTMFVPTTDPGLSGC